MVDVVGKTMASYEDDIVKFSDGEELYSEMVIWTAGVTGEPIEMFGTDVKRGPGNRFIVDEYNRIIGMNDVYALGDISLMMSDAYPKGHPQLAQVAIQQAKLLAKQLNKGEFKQAFKYVDKGSMATGTKSSSCRFETYSFIWSSCMVDMDVYPLDFDTWYAQQDYCLDYMGVGLFHL